MEIDFEISFAQQTSQNNDNAKGGAGTGNHITLIKVTQETPIVDIKCIGFDVEDTKHRRRVLGSYGYEMIRNCWNEPVIIIVGGSNYFSWADYRSIYFYNCAKNHLTLVDSKVCF